MTRRASRITHDEVCRVIKAVQSRGLSIGQVVFDGERVRVVIGGDSGEDAGRDVDGPRDPETFQTFEEYRAWRDGSLAGAD